MASFNKVILMGRLTADPELKQTGSGVPVTNFTIAVDRKYNNGNERQTDFPTIIAWRKTAEFICKYFKKGSAILVEGELQTRSWQDNNGSKRFATEVVASEVNFCEAKKEAEGNNTASNNQAPSTPKFEPYIPDAYKGEDLPF